MTGFDITAYILAGGGSRRMGRDKLFLQMDGQSLLERTIAACKNACNQVKLVSADAAKFSDLEYPVVTDSPEARGPMGGVIAALEDCRDDYCFVTAADLFDLGHEIINSLIKNYSGQQYLGIREPGGVQPLCGIYNRSALEILYRFAQEGEFSMKKAVEAMRYKTVALPAGEWRNINSPEDLVHGGPNG